MDGALAEFLAQAAIDRLRQAHACQAFVALHADVVLLDVDDAPLHERIHQHRLVLGSHELLRLLRIEREDARVEVTHVVDQRDLEKQPGAGLDRNDLAEPEHDGVLALVHGEQAQAGHHQRDDQGYQCGAYAESHLASLSRLRKASRERGDTSAGAGAGTTVSVGACFEAGSTGGTELVLSCMSLSSGR